MSNAANAQTALAPRYYVFNALDRSKVWNIAAYNSFHARRTVAAQNGLDYLELYGVRDDLMKDGDWARYRNAETQTYIA